MASKGLENNERSVFAQPFTNFDLNKIIGTFVWTLVASALLQYLLVVNAFVFV